MPPKVNRIRFARKLSALTTFSAYYLSAHFMDLTRKIKKMNDAFFIEDRPLSKALFLQFKTVKKGFLKKYLNGFI